MRFEPHQQIDAMSSRESRNVMELVLARAAREIRGDACVEGSVSPTCEDVDRGLFHEAEGSLGWGRGRSNSLRSWEWRGVSRQHGERGELGEHGEHGAACRRG